MLICISLQVALWQLMARPLSQNLIHLEYHLNFKFRLALLTISYGVWKVMGTMHQSAHEILVSKALYWHIVKSFLLFSGLEISDLHLM